MDRIKRVVIRPKTFLNDEDLILYVSEFPVLWDKAYNKYRDKTETAAAWQRICNRFTVSSPSSCSKLWHQLRRARRSRMTEIAGKSGDAAPNPPLKAYKYAKQMSFLDGHDSPFAKKKEGNLQVRNETDAEQSDCSMNALDHSMKQYLSDIGRESDSETCGVPKKLFMSGQKRPLSEVQSNFDDSMEKPGGSPPKISVSGEKENKAPQRHPKPKRMKKDVKFNASLSTVEEEEEDKDLLGNDEGSQSPSYIKHKKAEAKQQQYNQKRELVREKLDKQILAAEVRVKEQEKRKKEVVKDNEKKEVVQDNVQQQIVNVQQQILSVLQEPQDDACTHFCLALADKMRKLPPKVCTGLEIKFLQLVLSAADACDPPPAASTSSMALDGKAENEVDLAISCDDHAIVVKGFNLEIRGRDIKTLLPRAWLNDQIMNYYLKLIQKRGTKMGFPKVFSFSTYFYESLTNRRLPGVGKDVNIWDYEILFVPVHVENNHWCLITVDMKAKKLTFYNSMGGDHESTNIVLNYVKSQASHQDILWETQYEQAAPKQQNSIDCGVFCCKYAEFVSRGAKLTFNQEDMPHFRRAMVYEILQEELLS